MKFATGLAFLAITIAALIAEEPGIRPSYTIPKNLARQHYGANLLIFDTSSQRYVATEAAAAWLDDDIATGRPAPAGRQHYLLQLADTQYLTNFSVSGRLAAGTISLFTGNQSAVPGDKSWTLAAKEVASTELNHRKLTKLVNQRARYVLIETNFSESSPFYSLYLYGDKAAVSERIVKRAEPVDIRTVAGEFVNDQTSFNIASIYANARVSFSNSGGSTAAWQRAIDDNPESLIHLKPGQTEAGLVVRLDRTHEISRVSLLADMAAKGKVDVFLLGELPKANQVISLEGLEPSATLNFNGTVDRATAEVPKVPAGAVALRWTPSTPDSTLTIREVNAFSDLSLKEYELVTSGELAGDGKELLPIGEGKETIDLKGGTPLDPIATGPGTGFRPGNLGFPPNIRQPGTVIDPKQPVSP